MGVEIKEKEKDQLYLKFSAGVDSVDTNRELRLIAGVVVFLMHLGLRIKSQRVGRNPRAKAIVREEKCVRFSTRFPYFRLSLRAW